MGHGEALPAIGRWQIGAIVTVGAIVLLGKGDHDRLTSLPALQAVPALYQGLCEHPRVVTSGDPHRAHLFDVACGLARAAPAWQLDAALDGRFWEYLPVAVGN